MKHGNRSEVQSRGWWVNWKLAVLVVGWVWIIGVFCGMAVARADDGDDDTTKASICTAWNLGESPGQIADQLHQGQPRFPIWTTTRQTWDTLQEGC